MSNQLVEVVNAVKAIGYSYLEPIDEIIPKHPMAQEEEQWVYVTDPGYTNCEHCLGHEAQVFVRNQELDLIDIFPDLTYDNAVTISPNVHMTLWGKKTCQCKMFLSNLAKLVDEQPVKPVMDTPLIDEFVKPVEPKILLENPFKIEPDQTRLTGNQYTSFLDGLLYLGYISTAIYNVIINRRQDQKMTKQEILVYLEKVNASSSLWSEIQTLINKM